MSTPRFVVSLIGLASFVAGCGGGGSTPAAQQKPVDSPFATAAAAEGWSSSGPRTTAVGAAPPSFTSPGQLIVGPVIQPTATDPSVLAGPPVNNSNGSAAPVSITLPNIPAGARFTIYCESYTNADHVAFAANVKNLLVANTKLKDWYVVHQANQSVLYHGYYAEFDPKNAGRDAAMKRDADRAQGDHHLVESIPNPTSPDRKMFPRSLFVPLDAPDPDAPPAWNLTNAPGYWTVQIAAYTGPERKQAAVESVRAARAMNVPAFYYHGENISSVCVGSWDRAAIKEQSTAQPGSIDFDRGAREQSEMIVNLTGEPLVPTDPSGKPRLDANGKPVRVLQAKLVILDPSLTATLRQYPEHAVDGRVQMIEASDKQDGHKFNTPRPSYIVQIPRGPGVANASAASSVGDPDAGLIDPGATRQDLGARLRGLGR